MMNSFYDLLKKRHSIRRFQPGAVDQILVDKIVRAGLMAPSSRGLKPWQFIVVDQKDVLTDLSKTRTSGSHFIAHASLAIVVLADTSLSDVWLEDASIAAILMQLQAADIGLGSCWVQIYQRMHSEMVTAEDYVRQLLAIPSNMGVACILAIGHPDEFKAPVDDDALAFDKIHYNRYYI